MITLTNGVQIPENAVQLQTTAAVDGYHVTRPLQLVQYDQTLPVAAVQLVYQSQPYIPPTGAELNVRMVKSDGTTVYNPCLGVDSSSIVYFVFTQQMTAAAGDGKLTVEVTDSGVKNSAPIIVNVAENPVQEGSIESADEFLTLQEILAEAEKWGQIVQANASNIQQVVDNLTDIQNAAENAQAAAESAAAAQQAAQEALGFRKFYSAVVPDANGNLDPSRPMTVGPAASVEIESAGDRIQSVTALGFTQQEGTGDPSPTNIRQLTNGGLKLVEVTFTGSESWRLQSGAYLASGFTAGLANGVGYASPVKFQYGYGGQGIFVDGTGAACLGSGAVTALGYTDVSQWKADLRAAYNAGTPYKMWYQPADESDATGLYAPIILQGGKYRATCLPLTAPLCEGDSVVSWVKSGCDKAITFDGSEDEKWETHKNGFVIWGVFVNSVPMSPSDKTENIYTNILYQQLQDSRDQHAVGTFYAVNTPASGNFLVVNLNGDTDISAFRAALAAHPLTVWYRSTNYTEAADIPVSLETHQRAVLVLDGTEAWRQQSAEGQIYVTMRSPKPYSNFYCTEFKYISSTSAGGAYLESNLKINPTGGQFGDLIGSGLSAAEVIRKWKEHLAAQYAAGTPVTIVYELATHITYAHPAVVLEAATGDQLTYTATGQSGGTVSVSLKPFQDGGRAAMADNATNAVTAQTAANSQQLDGLTLAALQNLLVPVGYIFSWAPVGDGPDLSTPAKVAAYFGFGTWAAYGTGQVLVGVDSGQTEFATVGQTGGEKTHTLKVNEIPAHNHETNISDTAGENYLPLSTKAAANVSAQIVTTDTGGGQAHNNLQPYVVVYRWQRVA